MIKARYNAKVFSGKTADLENSNRIFAKNEIIIDEDTGDAKFGNGEDKYSDLPELGGGEGSKGEKGDKGDKGEKGDPGEKGEPGADGKDGKDGFPSESDWNDLVSRVEALENEE